MKHVHPILLACQLFILLTLSSCKDSKQTEAVTTYFRKFKCGSSPDCAILLQQTTEPSQWDHVITVHGFVNDDEIAHKLTDYLNASTNSNYRVMLLNQ